MTTRRQVIDICLSMPFVYEDYPFDDNNWTAMRHRGSRKIFALIFERAEKIWVNVKVQPEWGDFWRNTYDAIVPAYHMNKTHWISVILDGSVPQEVILRLLQDSFVLTAPRRRVD